MSPTPRISKIDLQDFRFFPGNDMCTFDLGGEGKNLLLFGENGSGKSSLFQGLRLLLTERKPPKLFAEYRNIFSAGDEGTISVKLTAGAKQDFSWDYGEPHPSETEGAAFLDLARRATFLDYKALMRTNVLHEEEECINLFTLLIETILRNAKLPDGRTVYEHWMDLKTFVPKAAPPSGPEEEPEELPAAVEQINEAAKTFRDQFNELLNVTAGGRQSLVERANTILGKLTTGLQIKTEVGTLEVLDLSGYTRPHTFKGTEVRLSAEFGGKPIEHPALFLNEARLTAIALALYLAATQSTTPAGGAGDVLRLLVLDDVLIGLDWANRLPVLNILNEEFADWQVILLTFDRVWFDLAKEYTEHTGRWQYLTLRELPGALDMPGRPSVELPLNYLTRADTHLQSGDLMAAAVYIRAAFETRVKNVCEKHGIKVAFKPDPKDVKIDQLWHEIVERQKSRQTSGQIDFISPALMQEVETVRSTVLNRLSHSGTPTFNTTEVTAALRIIRDLQGHEFRKVH